MAGPETNDLTSKAAPIIANISHVAHATVTSVGTAPLSGRLEIKVASADSSKCSTTEEQSSKIPKDPDFLKDCVKTVLETMCRTDHGLKQVSADFTECGIPSQSPASPLNVTVKCSDVNSR